MYKRFVLLVFLLMMSGAITIDANEDRKQQDLQKLISALSDKDASTRVKAAKALGESKDPHAVEPLIFALKDEDSGVREEAARALGNIKDSRSVRPLLTATKDKKISVMLQAEEALKKIGILAVESLITALEDQDQDIRASAAEVLGDIKDSLAVEPLISALNDKDIWVKREVVRSLGEIGDHRAAEPLITALKDDPSYIGSVVPEALVKMGMSELLLVSLSDWDYPLHVGSATVEALSEAKIDPKILPFFNHFRVLLSSPKVFGENRGPTVTDDLYLRSTPYSEPTILRVQTPGGWYFTIDICEMDSAFDALKSIGPQAFKSPTAYLTVPRFIEILKMEIDKDCGWSEGLFATKDVLRKSAEARKLFAVRTLNAITEQDFGENAEEWEKWWKQNRKTFNID